jgi:hypothetical protein
MHAVRVGTAALLAAVVGLGTQQRAFALVAPFATDEGYTTLTTIGMQTVTNANGTATVTFLTTGGGNPDVSASAFKSDATLGSCYDVGCGGTASLYGQYQFEWVTLAPPDTVTTTMAIAAMDLLVGANADAFLVISGINGTLYDQEDVLGTQIDGDVNTGPLSNQSITIYNNEPYTVELGVSAQPTALGNTAYAYEDPTLTLSDGSGGTLIYSDGIDVPEPASVALFGFGAAALGMIRRRRRV